jgi:hypothetical protein
MDDQEFYCQSCEAFITGRVVQRTPRSPGRPVLLILSSDGRAHRAFEGINFKWLTRKEIDAREKKKAERASERANFGDEPNLEVYERMFGKSKPVAEDDSDGLQNFSSSHSG